ncbi:Crp/Fnr family transcriptional regulator [Tenacibaculum piscium]|uniref:Crp/Fnr family transcriptional regulator n=1 Tax=Tenacibaculum piscium TaxID=1458515 RepID=A0A2H1YJ14_9FLAO|nr:Crp/Fnr family transcriptional regulator [Tenacibaculum piscium]MBE7628674.1 cyclic nucleotide-binding domain-containing protein [Tenacibaculum piscium]MBE7669815.1 cyclic nucleotide-binding domain-containing protein [Tenacibaculum piscium]MBE7684597.1 cyclic nucleotide-binding domain-containing protein [Tenacibaculum piscium]MBE7689217.1 cyclic nucleotide-binding domain-containing protein [Tenacibaculum piscium]MCG8182904.1 Crp/Fnr family transcriptional regulator [Tenacibaculum piscium]
MIEELQQHYGYIFEEKLINEIANVGVYKEFKENTVIIDADSYMFSIPLILSGAIKVLREDKDGDELVLYYIEKGDTCAMTLSCCMGETKSKIKAVAETDVTVLMIPKNKMSEWLSKYKSWQEYILQSYHSRLNEFIEAVDSIAFLNMNERLLKYLKDKAMVVGNDVLNVTHLEIANDLHTSRVVISRLLKALEKKSKIELHRNQIKILEL